LAHFCVTPEHCAATAGGIGFITAFQADVAHNKRLIAVHTLEAARQATRRKSRSRRLNLFS
jgi:hypothetical protein